MSSRTAVTTSDTSSDPAQPSRLLKKRNIEESFGVCREAADAPAPTLDEGRSGRVFVSAAPCGPSGGARRRRGPRSRRASPAAGRPSGRTPGSPVSGARAGVRVVVVRVGVGGRHRCLLCDSRRWCAQGLEPRAPMGAVRRRTRRRQPACAGRSVQWVAVDRPAGPGSLSTRRPEMTKAAGQRTDLRLPRSARL